MVRVMVVRIAQHNCDVTGASPGLRIGGFGLREEVYEEVFVVSFGGGGGGKGCQELTCQASTLELD